MPLPTTELSARVEVLFICLVQCGGQDSHVGVKYLKCGQCNQGTTLSFHLILGPRNSNAVAVCSHGKAQGQQGFSLRVWQVSAFNLVLLLEVQSPGREQHVRDSLSLPVSQS